MGTVNLPNGSGILVRMRLVPLLLPGALFAGGASAEERGPVNVTVQCEPVTEPGRVRCTAEARTDEMTMSWGDVVIESVPEHVQPLKARLGPEDAPVREPNFWRWTFAVVAKRAGQGDMKVQLRLVVCQKTQCRPTRVAASVPIRLSD